MKSINPQKDSEESILGTIAEVVFAFMMIFAVMGFIAMVVFVLPAAVTKELKEQAEALAAERYSIEGTIVSVEQLDRPDPFADDRDENGELKPGIRIHISHKSDQYTRVHFRDGRHRDFDGLYSKPFPIDEYVIIEYDGLDKIINIRKQTDETENDS